MRFIACIRVTNYVSLSRSAIRAVRSSTDHVIQDDVPGRGKFSESELECRPVLLLRNFCNDIFVRLFSAVHFTFFS